MRVWLKKNRFEDLAESFQDAGYESLEQVLMQLQFGEIKLDDTFIAKQLGVTDAERRRKVLSQLKQGKPSNVQQSDMSGSLRYRSKSKPFAIAARWLCS